jgi:hypothetical protein
MKCRDFERLINEQLDAREAAVPELERALESHGAACPACRAMSLRYQTLRQAIAALTPPAPAPDFAARFLAQGDWLGAASGASGGDADAGGTPRIFRRARASWPVTAAAAVLPTAAALLLMVGVGVRPGWLAGPGRVAAPRDRQLDPGALSAALAEATAATWDLARASSAPAARVGLEVLDASELSQTAGAFSLPLTGEEGPVSATAVLEDMGERVNEGVSPLSGTARHAFGFLLGPALAVPPPDTPPRPAEGA